MKKLLLLMVLGVVLASAFLVLAVNENNSNQNNSSNNSIGPGAQKNMTYWQCVSDAAKVKNDCYASAKNSTDVRQGKKDCKTAFKATKGECNSIKHTYWESFKALFV